VASELEVMSSNLHGGIILSTCFIFSFFADTEVTDFWFVRGLVNFNRLGHFHLKCEPLRHLNLNLESLPQERETRGAAAAGRAPLIADVTLRPNRCPPSRLPSAAACNVLAGTCDLSHPSSQPPAPNPSTQPTILFVARSLSVSLSLARARARSLSLPLPRHR